MPTNRGDELQVIRLFPAIAIENMSNFRRAGCFFTGWIRVRLGFSDDMWMESRNFIETAGGATGAGALTAMFGSDALGAVRWQSKGQLRL